MGCRLRLLVFEDSEFHSASSLFRFWFSRDDFILAESADFGNNRNVEWIFQPTVERRFRSDPEKVLSKNIRKIPRIPSKSTQPTVESYHFSPKKSSFPAFKRKRPFLLNRNSLFPRCFVLSLFHRWEEGGTPIS